MAMYSDFRNSNGFGTANRHNKESRSHNFPPSTLEAWERFVGIAGRFAVWKSLDHASIKEVFCSQIECGGGFVEATRVIREMVSMKLFHEKT